MADLEHRLELLETQYLTLRESVAKLEKVQYKIRDQIGFIEYMAKGPNYPDSLEERISQIIKAVDQIKHHLGMPDSSASSVMVHSSQSSQFVYAQTPQSVSAQSGYVQPGNVPAPQHPLSAQSGYAQPAPQTGYAQPGAVPAPQQPIATSQYQPAPQVQQPASIPAPQQPVSIGGSAIGSPQSAVPAPQPPITTSQPAERMRQEVQRQLQNQMAAAEDKTLYYQPGPQSPPPAVPVQQQAPSNQSSQPVLRPQEPQGGAKSSKRRKTVFRINPK